MISKPKDQLDEILEYIHHADDLEIQEIFDAIIERYNTYFPDWEVIFMSMHKDPEKRKEDIEGIIAMLRKSVQ